MERTLEIPTLIVSCGLPLVGKSTLADALSLRLGIHHLDIDDNVRMPLFGKPHPHPEASEELKALDNIQMRKSYDLFFEVMSIYMGELKKSLIVTATFSSKPHGQDRLRAVIDKNPGSQLKVIWCKVLHDTEVEIKLRLAKRKFGVNYFGATNSWERWEFLCGRYNPIELPHLLVETSRPVEECVDQMLDYVLADEQADLSLIT